MNQSEDMPVAASQPPPAADPPEDSQAERKALRRKTIKFVSIFVISVFSLLTAHEVFKNTLANDYYLFQVSRSTSFLLQHVGHSSRVLGHPRTYRGKEAWVRASLEAWSRGEETPPIEQFQGVKGNPLTPWEAWIYSAQSERLELKKLKNQYRQWQADKTLEDLSRSGDVQGLLSKIQKLQGHDQGPTVSFVLKPGVISLIADARKKLSEIKANESIQEAERTAQAEQATAVLKQLEGERDALQDQPDAAKRMADVSFSFVVVPDCGAIPSMVIFIAAVLAFPALWWKRLVGLVGGLSVLYFVNVLRLTFLAVLGAWNRGGPIFKFAHEYIWQGIYIIFVVAVWLAWVELLVRRKKA